MPVGINFTYPSKFNTTVMLRIGEPIKVVDYYTEYLKDAKTGHEALLDITFNKMKENIIHLENQNRVTVMEDLFIIERAKTKTTYLPVYLNNNIKLDNEKSIAKYLDNCNDAQFDKIRADIAILKKELEKQHLTINDLTKSPYNITKNFIMDYRSYFQIFLLKQKSNRKNLYPRS
ncbi:MAG: hypothetical protein IPO92_04225 [Saprospiraceae bacterium]|nr:hypothetical protein [Saprospiraceae bacterium]